MSLRTGALPDDETRSNRFEIAIPSLGSLILTHEWDGVVVNRRNQLRSGHPRSVRFE